MLSSALIGCFTVWLISVAHRKETKGNIYISILSHAVISLGNYTVNKMRASAWNITFISMICHFRCCPCLFLPNTCRTSDVRLAAGIEGGVTISDYDCYVTVGVMF